MPIALLGQHGIYPWYRPLSRELYFEAVGGAGPASPIVAHLLSIACLFGIAWALFRLAERLLGRGAAPIAPVLFVTYGFTKFLTAWPSGFQDLLATLLVLLGLLAHVRGRLGWSVAFSALAPLAKETGFVAAPLILLYSSVCQRRFRLDRWTLLPVTGMLGAAAIHYAVRASWHGGGTSARIAPSGVNLASGVGQALGGFLSSPGTPGSSAVLLGLTAGVCAMLLSKVQRGEPKDDVERPPLGPTIVFLGTAALFGLAPMVMGHLLRLTNPHPYYAFPAIPWLALLVGAALARIPGYSVLVMAIVAVNVMGLGYREPDLDSVAGWQFRRWDWPEAIRLSQASRRLGDDVRSLLASRPESLVVLYGRVPEGCLFQTEDGPATRISLGDPTVRAYYMSQAPPRLRRSQFTILSFDDPSLHLVPESPGTKHCFDLAATALTLGQPRVAFTWLTYARDSAHFELAYARAAAILVDEGAASFESEMVRIGLADSTGSAPTQRVVAMLGSRNPGLTLAAETMLRHPRSAAPHAALGDSFVARGIRVTGGMELRIAVSLDPRRGGDHFRLGMLLAQLNEAVAARAELERALAEARTTEDADRARAALSTLGPS